MVDIHGAGADALGFLALDAALRFQKGELLGEAEIDFLEVAAAPERFLLRHALPGDLHPLFGRDLRFHDGSAADKAFSFGAGGVGALLEFAVGLQTVREQVEIDLVPVEFGAVHAGELPFSADIDAAPAAHARAVDHDGVEAHQRLDLV
jgi:hypothetical protein